MAVAKRWILGFLATSLLACSSTDSTFTAGAPTSTLPQSQNPPPLLGVAGSAQNGPPGVEGGLNMPTGGIAAQDTSDGLQPITPEGAAALQNPQEVCTGWSESAKAQPSVLEFVIDVSGSMREKTASTNGDSKWDVTRLALSKAVALLPDSIAVGFLFFPNMISHDSATPLSATECLNSEDNVPIAPLTVTQRSALDEALQDIEPKTLGATPTHDAVKLGVAELQATTLPGERHLVLITDGQPTLAENCLGTIDMCNPQPTSPIVQAIAAARSQQNIRTFVVGSPGSEANECTGADVRPWLSEAARGGGTAQAGCSDQGSPYCHFDISVAADFGQGLAAALGTIAVSVVSCNYDVPPPPAGQTIDPSRTNLIYDDGNGQKSVVLPYTDPAATCDRGWRFTDSTSSHIEICNKTCEIIKSNPSATMKLVFGCATGTVLPVK